MNYKCIAVHISRQSLYNPFSIAVKIKEKKKKKKKKNRTAEKRKAKNRIIFPK